MMSKTSEMSKNMNFLSWLKQSSIPSIEEELPELYQDGKYPTIEGPEGSVNGNNEKKIMMKGVLNLKEKLKEDLPEMHQEKVDPTIGGMDDILIAQNDMVIEIDSELLKENSENDEDEMKLNMMKAVLNLKPKIVTIETNNTKQFIKKKLKKCPECDMSLNNLIEHMRSVHEKELKYACNVCNYKSYHKNDVARHQPRQHGIKDSSIRILKLDCNKCINGEIHEHEVIKGKHKKIKKCERCEFETYKRKYLIKHEQFSHNSTYTILKCEKCEFETNKKTSLQTHIRSIHELKYKCSECEYKSHHKNLVNHHLKKMHKRGLKRIIGMDCEMCEDGEVHENCSFEIGKDSLLKCVECDYGTHKKILLENHIKSIHDKVVRYSCSICDMKHFSKYQVQRHILHTNTHSGAKVLRLDCVQCQTGEIHSKCFVKSTQEYTTEYSCKNCDFKTVIKAYMTKHEKISHIGNGSILKCEKCDYETNKKQPLQNHMKIVHDKNVRYACSNCDRKSFYKQHVQDHIRNNHKNSAAKVLEIGCDTCNTGENHAICFVQSRIKANKQIKSTEENTTKYSCKYCDFKTVIKAHMTKHEKISHISNGSILKCGKCDYETNAKRSLQNHIKIVHDKNVRYSCSNCDRKSFYKNHIQDHIRSKHKNSAAKVLGIGCDTCITAENHAICFVESRIKANKQTKSTNKQTKSAPPLICDICPFIPMDHRELVEHMKKVHPTEGLFSCDSCNYKSNYMPNLKGHKSAKHEEKLNECNLCEYKTKWRVMYSQHRRIEHTIFSRKKRKPQMKKLLCDQREFTKRFYCDQCKFASISAMTMKLHRAQNLDHIGRAQNLDHIGFLCTQCGLKVKTKQNLKKHMRAVHEKELRYACNVCKFVSFQKRNLAKHQARHRSENSRLRILRLNCNKCENGEIHEHEPETEESLCDQCGFASISQMVMKLHTAQHINVINVICEECGKNTKGNESLRYHMDQHKDISKKYCKQCQHFKDIEIFDNHSCSYVCDICMKGVSSKGILKNHKLLHTKNIKEAKKYHCKYCQKSFTQKGNMFTHINKKHMEKVIEQQ